MFISACFWVLSTLFFSGFGRADAKSWKLTKWVMHMFGSIEDSGAPLQTPLFGRSSGVRVGRVLLSPPSVLWKRRNIWKIPKKLQKEHTNKTAWCEPAKWNWEQRESRNFRDFSPEQQLDGCGVLGTATLQRCCIVNFGGPGLLIPAVRARRPLFLKAMKHKPPTKGGPSSGVQREPFWQLKTHSWPFLEKYQRLTDNNRLLPEQLVTDNCGQPASVT